MSRRPILAATIALTLVAPSAHSATIYWDGTGTDWESLLSWSVDPANPDVDPPAVPGNADLAVFNVSSVTTPQTVNLNADQAAVGIAVNSTGSVTLLGGNADHALSLGANGITSNAGAGPLVIGSATAGQQVVLSLEGSQSWINNSGAASLSAITVQNAVILGVPGPATLTFGGNTPAVTTVNIVNGSINEGVGTLSLTMAGGATNRWQLNAANNYSGLTSVTGGALRITNPGALGSTVAGTVVSTSGALVLDNAGTVTGEALTLNGDGPAGFNFGALQSASGTNRWANDITVNTGTGTGRIGAVNSSTLILPGTITGTGTGQLVFQTGTSTSNSGTILVSGNISFPGQRLTKSATGQSTGTVILTGNNDYGNTIISSGILQFGNGGTTGNLGTGTVTISNTAGGTLAFNRSDAITISNTLSGAGAVSHRGTGILTLNGANTLTGGTSAVGGGLLLLDFSLSPTNVAGTGALTLAGSSLMLLGNANIASSQTFSGTNLNAGGSRLFVDANGGPGTTVALGAFTRAAGGTLNFEPTENTTITTATPNTNDIIGGYITVGSSTWAANDGAGNLVPLTTYSNDLAGTGNLDVPAGGGTLAANPNTIRFNDPNPNTLTLDAPRTITSGGILVTPNVGGNPTQISGNFTLSTVSPPTADLIIWQNNTAAGLTIGANIGSSLTKQGDGLLTLTGGNVASFTTRIVGGTLSVSLATNLGGMGGVGAIVFPPGSTGALQLSGNGTFISSKGMTLTGNGKVDVPELATFTGATSITGPGRFTKTGAGTLVFSGATNTNNYTGVTVIQGGTLQVTTLANGGVASGIGSSTSDAANLILDGGTLRYSSATVAATTDRLFTVGPGGGTLDASGAIGASVQFTNPGVISLSGTDTARTFVLAGTNPDFNTLTPVLGDNGTGATLLQKTGPGAWILAGANTYSGGTVVLGGTLAAAVDGALGTGNVTVDATAINLTISSGITNAIGNTAALNLVGDGVIDNAAISGFAFLASGVNEVVGGLVLGGVPQLQAGTYGATGSGATHVFDDYFQGTGVVTLIPEPATVITILSGLGVLVGAQRIRRRR